MVSEPALYVPVTLLVSGPFRRQVTLARWASLAVPVTFSVTALTLMANPSALPPSLRVKSKTLTASPTVSMVVAKATGSVTKAALVRPPSASATMAVIWLLSATDSPPDEARKLKLSLKLPLAVYVRFKAVNVETPEDGAILTVAPLPSVSPVPVIVALPVPFTSLKVISVL